METILIKIPNGEIGVTVVRKKIKNVHLKVYRDLKVMISVPLKTPNEWIENYLNEHSNWIDGQLVKYQKSSGYNNLSSLKSGSSTQMLGKDLRVYIVKDESDFVEKSDKSVTIHLIKPKDSERENVVFEKWWREFAFEFYNNVISELMPIFERHKIERPSLVIKKMKTLWGSCSKHLGKICLNEYLLKADKRCIEYVVLHELTHLIYNGHNKDFYSFITIYMPDWKERKKQLDTEVVQGL